MEEAYATHVNVEVRRWFLESLAAILVYSETEEPMIMSTEEKKIYTYDPKVAAIHRLRVNVKSLSAESRIIRKEAKRADFMYEMDLTMHRRGRLRSESRVAHLALAFVRGRRCSAVDKTALLNVMPKRLHQKITAAGYRIDEQAVATWMKSS